jgi:steroid delta-isomerase
MSDAENMKDAVRRYVQLLTDSDVEGIVGLYADDGKMEDPVGTPPHQGHDALRQFYTATAPALSVEIAGPICVAGKSAAALLLARLTMGEDNHAWIDATDVFTFNDAGLLQEVRAYWNPAEMRPTRES